MASLGTLNADGHPVDSKGNPQIDFVWGNFPLTGNDQRATVLDFTKSVHEIAEEGWNGYPQYSPNTSGVKAAGVDYVIVPNVLGELTADASKALTDAGLAVTVGAATAGGGTSGTIKAQSIAAGAASVAPGAAITITPVS
jgi:hypothetical protein